MEPTYTVRASYAGGPSEVVDSGLDRSEAIAIAHEWRCQRGWDAYIEEDEE